MKITDFQIGTRFQTITGQVWQCTDVGTRTIAAIEIYAPDFEIDGHPPIRRRPLPEVWFKGPPYALKEHLFNEDDIDRAYVDYIEESISEIHQSAHPGYPHQLLFRKGNRETRLVYPRKSILKHDRVRSDGRIFHPYGAEALDSDGGIRKEIGENEVHALHWMILAFDVFSHEDIRVPEDDFVAFPVATEGDYGRAKNST